MRRRSHRWNCLSLCLLVLFLQFDARALDGKRRVLCLLYLWCLAYCSAPAVDVDEHYR